MKDKETILKRLVYETIANMKDRQKVIVFATDNKEEAIKKRKESLGYVMKQLDKIYNILQK